MQIDEHFSGHNVHLVHRVFQIEVCNNLVLDGICKSVCEMGNIVLQPCLVCVCERARAPVCVCVCVRVRACVCVCVCEI